MQVSGFIAWILANVIYIESLPLKVDANVSSVQLKTYYALLLPVPGGGEEGGCSY